MERIHTLIDKLAQQKAQNAPASHLLFTVQLLHKELTQQAGKIDAAAQRKVSVTLPVNLNFSEEALRVSFTESSAAKEVFELRADSTEEEPVPVQEVEQPVHEYKEYALRKPTAAPPVYEKPQPVPREEALPAAFYNEAFDTVTEAPTLTQYATRKEINHTLTQAQPSLNDRLKEQRNEVAHRLKDAPVKDLRKAIGINDRFVFIKELFRGDEAMYERSVKTINNFNIYSEAEYWMARELGVKLAWPEANETVQHFYQLVRRRFS